MMRQNDESDFSDEELHWGKMTPYHVEKSVSLSIQRHKLLKSFGEIKSSKDPTSIAADIDRYFIEQSRDNNLESVDSLNKQEEGSDEILSQSSTRNEGELRGRNEGVAGALKLLMNIESSATNTTPNNIKKIKVGSSLNSAEKSPYILKTPKSKTFDHIVSPVATYIRQSPQVPLFKDVTPMKPLPTSSLTPKLARKTPKFKIRDKENVVLPQLAYRSAKETLLINLDKEKLPQGIWAQHLQSTAQKPVVVKHKLRESGRKPPVSQQDSIGDLSLHQADVSICTEKQAFSELNKKN